MSESKGTAAMAEGVGDEWLDATRKRGMCVERMVLVPMCAKVPVRGSGRRTSNAYGGEGLVDDLPSEGVVDAAAVVRARVCTISDEIGRGGSCGTAGDSGARGRRSGGRRSLAVVPGCLGECGPAGRGQCECASSIEHFYV